MTASNGFDIMSVARQTRMNGIEIVGLQVSALGRKYHLSNLAVEFGSSTTITRLIVSEETSRSTL